MPQNQPKKSNPSLWIVLILVALIASAAILYFGDFFNTNTNSKTNTVLNVNTNVSVNANTVGNQNSISSTMKVPFLTENEATGLQVFIEKNNSFTINIPRGVYIWERDETGQPMYIVLSSSEDYISTLEADFWAKIVSVKDEIAGFSEHDALTYESGRDALPIVEEQFLTINNNPAYRAFRQVKVGDKLMGNEIASETLTAVEYSFLKNNSLYILRSNITGTNQEYFINMVDQIAQTFK